MVYIFKLNLNLEFSTNVRLHHTYQEVFETSFLNDIISVKYKFTF